MKKVLIILSLILACAPAAASEPGAEATPTWTMQQCMSYAVAHNHEVKRAQLELDNYKASLSGAAGRFLPAVDAGIGAQYNFGRAIDPETNGYTDVSTFYNGYAVSASLPLFDGFSRLHALQAAKSSVLMGRESLRQQQDLTALSVMQAFANAAYYDGVVEMAQEKVAEVTLLLRQTRLLEEVGRKSAAEVVQVEAQLAEAAYELTRLQNLQASALLELKKEMGYPLADSISCEAPTLRREDTPLAKCALGQSNPELLAAQHQVKAAQHEWRQAQAALYPSLSLSGGLSTTYYKTLHSTTAPTFSSQLKNNMGEYVGINLSIPLFNRLQSITGIRRAKNNYQIARENYAQKQLELEKLSREAWQDWQGYLKQTAQMEKKVEADSLAYQLVRRQFEEGRSTAIDLRTTSSQLLQSRAALLQCQLMAIVKKQLVIYYNGETIWTE